MATGSRGNAKGIMASTVSEQTDDPEMVKLKQKMVPPKNKRAFKLFGKNK